MPAPPVSEASGFLASPVDARGVEKNVGTGGSVQVRESAKTLFMEARPAAARRAPGCIATIRPGDGPDEAAPPRVRGGVADAVGPWLSGGYGGS
jgi:hypothetical protein